MILRAVGSGVYAYRSVRDGGRVRSVYCGRGEAAVVAAELARLGRIEATEARAAEDARLSWLAEADRAMAGYCASVDAALRLALERAGYRQHHRSEWRKRRG